MLKEIGITPKIVRLEENYDPDEYILKYGAEKFKTKIENPESSIEFLMKLHKSNKNLTDINDISNYIDESLKDLVNTNDSILVELTLKKLSIEFNIDYNTIKNKYDNLIEVKNKEKTPKFETIKIKPKYDKYNNASRILLFYMLKDKNIIEIVESNVTYFPDDNIRILSNEIIHYYRKYGIFNIADFISYITIKEELMKIFNEIINMDIKEKYSKEEINDYIKLINSYPIDKKSVELNQKLKEEKDPIKQASILSEILKIKGVKQ